MDPSSAFTPVIEALAQPLGLALVALVGLTLLRALLRDLISKQRGRTGEARVHRQLRRCFEAVRSDGYLRTRSGGLTQIDHLALTPKGILVVETKHYAGKVYGQGDGRYWRQFLGRREHRFLNPLHQNAGHVRAVRLALKAYPDVPVLSYVVFSGTAKLKLKRAEGVGRLARFKRDCRTLCAGEVSERYRQAWAQLVSVLQDDAATRKEHLKAVKQKRSAFA